MEDPILLFDGVCNLCNGFVRFILKNEKNHRIRFTSIQSQNGQQLLKKYVVSQNEYESIVFIENNKVFEKSTAVLKVISNLGYPWKIIYVCRFIPAFIRDKIYLSIARKRYKYFGKRSACMVPPEKYKERFLD